MHHNGMGGLENPKSGNPLKPKDLDRGREAMEPEFLMRIPWGDSYAN